MSGHGGSSQVQQEGADRALPVGGAGDNDGLNTSTD